MKKVLSALTPLALLWCTAAQPQVVLTASKAVYPYSVLTGSQRQLLATETGLGSGQSKLVNWSILSTTGGATAVLDRTTNAPGTTGITFGGAPGHCAINGPVSPSGSNTITSTATVEVQVQSVADPAKTDTIHFNVCANTTTVQILPSYQQAYQGQPRDLTAFVIGNTDESGTWSIVSQPPGASVTLPDTNKRDTIFTGTVTGRYTLKYTSASDPGKSGTAIVYVGPDALPGYGATTRLTQPTECAVDPALGGKAYEVGPGLAHKTVREIDATTWNAGSILRIHNVDTTGHSPTVYHETIDIKKGGTATKPVIVCGVPDSLGNMPILDGANAQSATSTYGVADAGLAIVFLGGPSAYHSPYSAGSVGPDYVVISGLSIRNARTEFNHLTGVPVAPTAPYGQGSACIRHGSGQHVLLEGNDLSNCANGIFNQNTTGGNGFAHITEFLTIRGNRIGKTGVAANGQEHDVYLQSFWNVVEGNRFESQIYETYGDAIKYRGSETIFRYNFFDMGFSGAQLINMEDANDPMNFLVNEVEYGVPGNTTCHEVYCNYDHSFLPDMLAAYQEGIMKDSIFGNIFQYRSAIAAIQHSETIGGDHSGEWGGTENDLADHVGTIWAYSNTFDAPEGTVFADTVNNSTQPLQFMPRYKLLNNIFYKPLQTPFTQFLFDYDGIFTGTFQTNLVGAGTVDVSTPNNGTRPDPGGNSYGLSNYMRTPVNTPAGATPIDSHLFGYNAANILPATCQPYNMATFAPIAGCGAVGTATPMTDAFAALLPVRYQYDVENSRLVPRTVNNLGAVETGTQPTLSSIAWTPETLAVFETIYGTSNSYALNPGDGGQYAALDCTYSDGIHNNCGPYASVTFSKPRDWIAQGGTKFLANTNFRDHASTVTATVAGHSTAPAMAHLNSSGTTVRIYSDHNYSNLPVGASEQHPVFAAVIGQHGPGDLDVTKNPGVWSSNNLSVATVKDGLITKVGPGGAVITYRYGGMYGIFPVDDYGPAKTVARVALTGTYSTPPGTLANMQCMATMTDGTTADMSGGAVWTSSNPAVATVSSNQPDVVGGTITGIAKGTTTISATIGGVTQSHLFTVGGGE